MIDKNLKLGELFLKLKSVKDFDSRSVIENYSLLSFEIIKACGANQKGLSLILNNALSFDKEMIEDKDNSATNFSSPLEGDLRLMATFFEEVVQDFRIERDVAQYFQDIEDPNPYKSEFIKFFRAINFIEEIESVFEIDEDQAKIILFFQLLKNNFNILNQEFNFQEKLKLWCLEKNRNETFNKFILYQTMLQNFVGSEKVDNILVCRSTLMAYLAKNDVENNGFSDAELEKINFYLLKFSLCEIDAFIGANMIRSNNESNKAQVHAIF